MNWYPLGCKARLLPVWYHAVTSQQAENFNIPLKWVCHDCEKLTTSLHGEDGREHVGNCSESMQWYKIIDTVTFSNLCSSLDPQLQKALKDYLVVRGITPKLTNFLLEHLHRKEHSQYVNWLRTMEGIVAE
ncbi:hypothetical protein BHM03_00026625 [Ensete ventricosum]|nr:hypothetical protein BHM03_00026625 [Ensete ventricosum]